MRATMNEVTLVAPDISCGHCVATIQEAVVALEGVARVAADPVTKQVRPTPVPADACRSGSRFTHVSTWVV